MKIIATLFFMILLLGDTYAAECYQSYTYRSEALVSSGKNTAEGKSQIEGVLHTRSYTGDDKFRETIFFLEAKKTEMTFSVGIDNLEKSISYPVKVTYHRNGFPKKILALDSNKNPILNGIVREFFYPEKSGTYQFKLDEVESRYQIEMHEDFMQALPLDMGSSTEGMTVIKSDYQTNLAENNCYFLNEARSYREVLHTSELLKNKLLIKSGFDLAIDKTAALSGTHWFMKLRFDDPSWLAPDFSIETELSAAAAKQQITHLIEKFRSNPNNTDLLQAQIKAQDTWLIYLPRFLVENPLSTEVSENLFLVLGKLNSRLSVEVLNLVSQEPSVNEDDRFRAVAALLTTDTPLSTTVLANIQQAINNRQFIEQDVSSKAYIMSIGAIAANREDTAPGQTASLRTALVGKLSTANDPTVAVINAVGNLRQSHDRESLLALESIALNPTAMSKHQKTASISSLARLEASTLSIDQMQYQIKTEKSPAVQKEWVGLAARSNSVNVTSAKQLLLSVAENQKADNIVRDHAIMELVDQLPAVLDGSDTRRIRQLIPSLESKEAKAAIYKFLVNPD